MIRAFILAMRKRTVGFKVRNKLVCLFNGFGGHQVTACSNQTTDQGGKRP